jgi:hypothetical protein
MTYIVVDQNDSQYKGNFLNRTMLANIVKKGGAFGMTTAKKI